MKLTLACVWTGRKYGPEFVQNLRAGALKHLPGHEFVIFTDKPKENVVAGARMVDVRPFELPGWWAKMAVFDPALRGEGTTIYSDLDNVLVGSLEPLVKVKKPFAICENFTRAAGNLAWPCTYGSTCMVMNGGFGAAVFRGFMERKAALMAACERGGDQEAIEILVGKEAPILQRLVPKGFFLGYRDLQNHFESKPKEASVVVYAGGRSPDTMGPGWARKAWRGK